MFVEAQEEDTEMFSRIKNGIDLALPLGEGYLVMSSLKLEDSV